jgi:type IV secretory pathway VirD2 relaxase
MRVVLAALFSAAVIACGRPSAPLPNSHDSVESLARAVLEAVERRDIATLQALALNREEFAEHIWPELPAARPERNLSVGFVWGDLNQKSNMMLRETLAAHGGKKYHLVRVQFLGETTPYESYAVHRESELTVKGPDGIDQKIRLFGSVMEKSKRFKVFSYVISD